MGISLKCGATKSHFSYRVWDNFRIAMSQACMQYIKNCKADNNSTISKEVLYEINKEYQLFTTQKEELQKFVKTTKYKC